METNLRCQFEGGQWREVRNRVLWSHAVSAFWTLLTYQFRYLDPESFVTAIAPKDDLTKIGRAQYEILFRVADTAKRGLVSWEDFVVFETVLKRPDADYWMAFQYFDTCVPTISPRLTCP